MQCPRCHAQVEEGAAFCGNCGNQLTPLYAQGATAAGEGTVLIPDRSLPNTPNAYPQNLKTVAAPPTYYDPTAPATPLQRNATPAPVVSPTPPENKRRDNRRVIWLAGILVLLAVVVVTGGVFALLSHKTNTTPTPTPSTNATKGTATNPASAVVSFSDSSTGGLTLVLNITASHLKAPPSGSQYYAWLLDTTNENVRALGQLQQQQGDVYQLTATNGHTNFLSQGNLIEITQESGANPAAPSGNNVILKGQFPAIALVHIRHLLVRFDTTPNNIGLLVGVRDQAEKLNTEAVLLKNAANNHNTFAEQCAAQSIIDIAEGKQSQAFQSLQQGCAAQNVTETGDGFGLLGNNGYIKTAFNHAVLAATGGDATDTIKLHAGHVETIMNNVQGWVNTVDKDAQFLLSHPNDTGKVQELAQDADKAYHGFSPNGEAQPQPVPGQGGAIQGYLHGQLMATLTLAPA